MGGGRKPGERRSDLHPCQIRETNFTKDLIIRNVVTETSTYNKRGHKEEEDLELEQEGTAKNADFEKET